MTLVTNHAYLVGEILCQLKPNVYVNQITTEQCMKQGIAQHIVTVSFTLLYIFYDHLFFRANYYLQQSPFLYLLLQELPRMMMSRKS